MVKNHLILLSLLLIWFLVHKHYLTCVKMPIFIRWHNYLRSAKVYVAPLGQGDAKALASALNKTAGFLRGRLGRQIDMKFTPELHFHADNSFDTASQVHKCMQPRQV